MSVSDSIGDFLTRIRNAGRARHASVELPTSKMREQICEILKKEGFISEFRVLPKPPRGVLSVDLKYRRDGNAMIHKIDRISTPGCRRYAGAEELSSVGSPISTVIVTTSKGLMTSAEATKAKLGGELLCELV